MSEKEGMSSEEHLKFSKKYRELEEVAPKMMAKDSETKEGSRVAFLDPGSETHNPDGSVSFTALTFHKREDVDKATEEVRRLANEHFDRARAQAAREAGEKELADLADENIELRKAGKRPHAYTVEDKKSEEVAAGDELAAKAHGVDFMPEEVELETEDSSTAEVLPEEMDDHLSRR